LNLSPINSGIPFSLQHRKKQVVNHMIFVL